MNIGTIKGIKIKLHVSTLVIIGLVGFYAASFYLSLNPGVSIAELIIIGIVNGIIILFSILAHELMHSLMAKRYGLNVSEIELNLFGGVSKIEEEPKTPKSEAIISVVGPLSSLVLGIMFFFFYFLIPTGSSTFISTTCYYSGITNIGLGLFNLLPAFPMDGGRVLRAILWNSRHNLLSATKTATRVGLFFGYGLIIYGLFQILFSGLLNGFWLILIGSFLNSSSRQSYMQTVHEVTLQSISVKDMFSTLKLTIPFNTLISVALKDYFMLYRKSYFPVTQGDKITGIIHVADIRRIPIEQRSEMIVGYLMKPIKDFPSIKIDETGKDALRKMMQMTNNPHILVVKDITEQNVMGFIGEEELMYSLKFFEGKK